MKPNDKVICIDDRMTSLTRGMTYCILHVIPLSDGTQSLILVGEVVPWAAFRFKLIPHKPTRTIK